MIFKESFLNIVDDSGISKVKFLRSLNMKSHATLGDLIKVSVRKRFRETSIVKRTLCLALVVNIRKKYRRRNGVCIKHELNNAILLNDDKTSLLLNPDDINVTYLPIEVLRFKGVNLRLLIKSVI